MSWKKVEVTVVFTPDEEFLKREKKKSKRIET